MEGKGREGEIVGRRELWVTADDEADKVCAVAVDSSVLLTPKRIWYLKINFQIDKTRLIWEKMQEKIEEKWIEILQSYTFSSLN